MRVRVSEAPDASRLRLRGSGIGLPLDWLAPPKCRTMDPSRPPPCDANPTALGSTLNAAQDLEEVRRRLSRVRRDRNPGAVARAAAYRRVRHPRANRPRPPAPGAARGRRRCAGPGPCPPPSTAPASWRAASCTPRGRHVIRAKIGAGAAPGSVFVGRRPTGERYTPALGAAHPDRDWILTRILWLSGTEPGRNRLGEPSTPCAATSTSTAVRTTST